MTDLGNLTPLLDFLVLRPKLFMAEEVMLSVMCGSISVAGRVENFDRGKANSSKLC